jgi:hypothetical protein
VREGAWPAPSDICVDPDQARACTVLPGFDSSLLESARLIAERYPLAETRYRQLRGKHRTAEEVPHFEKVFRIAAALAGVRGVLERYDYDELLVLTAWNCVRPKVDGFLASYPKSLLCPFSHAASPAALNELSTTRRQLFDRRAPIYLRYLLLEKFRLHTCGDIENADLRDLLRRAGFRLVRPSAAPEIAFPGITQGDDPPVRPWKLALRQELSDERAAEMLIQAALWQIKFGLRLVTGRRRWRVAPAPLEHRRVRPHGLGRRISFPRSACCSVIDARERAIGLARGPRALFEGDRHLAICRWRSSAKFWPATAREP